MGKEPPTHEARLEMFCSLVDEYDSLAEAFPVDQKSFNFGGPPRPAADRWHRIVRAMALRKFVLASTDAVYGPTVVDSLEALLKDHAERELLADIRDRFAKIATWMVVVEGDGQDRTVPELMKDLVYGNLLHGDYDKWLRARRRRGFMDEQALWMYTADAERYVRRLRLLIELADREDLLTAQVPGADRGEDEGVTSPTDDT